jgi:hypothetical protein
LFRGCRALLRVQNRRFRLEELYPVTPPSVIILIRAGPDPKRIYDIERGAGICDRSVNPVLGKRSALGMLGYAGENFGRFLKLPDLIGFAAHLLMREAEVVIALHGALEFVRPHFER